MSDPLMVTAVLPSFLTQPFVRKTSCGQRGAPEKIAQEALFKAIDQKEWKFVQRNAEKLALNEIQAAIVRASCVPEIFAALEKGLSLKKLEELTSTSTQKLQEELSRLLPKRSLEPQKLTWKQEAAKTASIIFNFFPHLLDTCIEVFNLFEAGKGPQTLWDFAATLEIYYKVFLVPKAVFMLVSLWLIAPTAVFATTTGIIFGLVTVLYAYLKWFRACPKQLPHCINLTDLQLKGQIEPVVGRDNEIDRIVGYLGRQSSRPVNVMLYGDPGIGKTEIAKALSFALLGKKTVFLLNTADLMGGLDAANEKLIRVISRIRGFEKNVVFIFDEIHQAIKDPILFGFLKPYLERGGIQVLAITTKAGFKEISEDKEFIERFRPMEISEASEAQTKLILNDQVLRSTARVRVDEEGIEAVWKAAQTKEGAFPRKAVHLLNEAINSLREYQESDYTPPDLSQKTEELDEKKQLLFSSTSLLMQQNAKFQKLKEEIVALEAEVKTLDLNAKRNQAILQQINALTNRERLIKNQIRDEVFERKNLKKLLINWALYLPAIDQKIKQLASGLGDAWPYQIDKKYIDSFVASK